MEESREFSWLHLSDLHARTRDDWDSSRVVDALIDDLKRCSEEHSLAPDAIFFSGDAVFGKTKEENLNEQFEKVGRFFDRVIEVFQPKIDKSKIFIVPGNHDIDRSEVSPAETQWLRDKDRSTGEIIAAQQDVTKQWRTWMERLSEYRKFLQDYGLTHLNPEHPSLLWGNRLVCNDLKIGICGLNTAWSCADNEDKGKLWTGGKWQCAEAKKDLKDCDFTIGIVHHPGNWLREDEDPSLGRLLSSEFNITLHGHEHVPHVDRMDRDHLKLSAGACYQCSWMKNGYNFGRIKVSDSQVSIFFREWDDDGGGWVPKEIFNKTKNGVYTMDGLKWLDDLKKKPLSSGIQDLPLVGDKFANESGSIIRVDSSPGKALFLSRFEGLRQSALVVEDHHKAVRVATRESFLQILERNRFCFLRSDWQMGRDGFLASAINEKFLGSKDKPDFFRVDCSRAVSPDDVLDAIGSQLGIPYAEFVELTKERDFVILLLEEIPLRKWNKSDYIEEFVTKLKASIEFSSNLSFVVTFRDAIPSCLLGESTELSSLTLRETSDYLQYHRLAEGYLSDPNIIEEIYNYSGGLPDALDRFVALSRSVSPRDILDEQINRKDGSENGVAPAGLKEAIEGLRLSEDKYSMRSYELLKLLTILKDGETFESIRRFYPTRPFYADNIRELVELSLIECVSLARSAEELIKDSGSFMQSSFDHQKLIRVPKQVRDYLETLIDHEERGKIFRAASDAFFGRNWADGRINTRKTLYYAYKDSSVSGPGNELVVTQFLLKSALDNHRRDRIGRYSRLAVGYCAELLGQDRFRDLVIAASSIRNILSKFDQPSEWAGVSAMLGTALRLTSQEKRAVEILEELWSNYSGETKSFKSDILFDLACCYKTLGEREKALVCAGSIIKLEPTESAMSLQARSLIFRVQRTGGALLSALRGLYQIANRKGYKQAAFNIALDIARITKDKKESISVLDAATKRAREPYSIARAITQKAEVLRKQGQLALLTSDELATLRGAYAYSYGQRLDSILNQSHDALWDFYEHENLKKPLFRLFRFSSFVWRLCGSSERESEYLIKVEVLLPSIEREDDLLDELDYVSSRLAHRID